MLPRHPYMLRALYDWLIDSDDMPHLLVNAEYEGVQVPGDYVQEGRIVLNIAPDAVENLSLGNDYIMFNARFGGRPMEIILPQESVIAIYGRNSGEGMMFNLDEADMPDTSGLESTFTEVEVDETDADADADAGKDTEAEKPGKGRKKRGKPNLKIIK